MVSKVYLGTGSVLSATAIDEYNNALNTTDPLANDRLSAFGEQLTAQLTAQAAWRQDYGSVPNTRLYSTTGTANGGTVTLSNSRAVLSTSTAVNGIARLSTLRRLRYMPGMGGLVRFTASFDTPATNSRQMIGLGDTQDGFFFGYVGTAFGVIRRRGGVDNFTAAQSWNGAPVDISPQFGNIYQIRFQWLGYGYIHFYIMDAKHPERGFVLVHTILYPNSSEETSILNPTLPIMAEVGNTGNATDIQLLTPSAAAFIEGTTSAPVNPLNVYNSVNAVATFADTNNNHVITIRNKATFGGVANRIPVSIANFTLGRSQAGAPLTTVRLYRDATFAGALTFTDIDTNSSPVEYSTTTTTITGGTSERTYLLTDNASSLITVPLTDDSFVLLPGQMLTIAMQNSSNVSTVVAATLNWVEEF